MSVRSRLFGQKEIELNSELINNYTQFRQDNHKPDINANGYRMLTTLDIDGGIIGFTPFGSTPVIQGATLAGSEVTLQPAGDGLPGGVSTANQVLGDGNKEAKGDLITRKRLRMPDSTDVNTGILTWGEPPLKQARMHTYSTFDHTVPGFNLNRNLFWGQESGNFTCTGPDNIGIGPGALTSLTSGKENVTLHSGNALADGNYMVLIHGGKSITSAATDGTGNPPGGDIVIGKDAGNAMTTGSYGSEVVIGRGAYKTWNDDGSAPPSVIIGSEAAYQSHVGGPNVVIGYQAATPSGTAGPVGLSSNVIVGATADAFCSNSAIANVILGSGPCNDQTSRVADRYKETWLGYFNYANTDSGVHLKTEKVYVSGIRNGTHETPIDQSYPVAVNNQEQLISYPYWPGTFFPGIGSSFTAFAFASGTRNNQIPFVAGGLAPNPFLSKTGNDFTVLTYGIFLIELRFHSITADTSFNIKHIINGGVDSDFSAYTGKLISGEPSTPVLMWTRQLSVNDVFTFHISGVTGTGTGNYGCDGVGGVNISFIRSG